MRWWYVIGGFFFFQAEDGIRDLVRSRGLGDVYKRQMDWTADSLDYFAGLITEIKGETSSQGPRHLNLTPVSYTHLTLPTSDLV